MIRADCESTTVLVPFTVPRPFSLILPSQQTTVYLPSGIIVIEYLRILLQVVPIQLVDAVTACLFFGYLDAATNIAETCDGGGGNNELPKRKDDEDELAFAKRCHQVAKAMFAPRYRLKRG
jgi:hypothetical protein